MAEKVVGPNLLDSLIGFVSPERGLRRLRARVASNLYARHYEGAAIGRRTQGWNRAMGDANAVTGPSLATLRASARDLVRNNGHAKKALRVIGNHVVGWGIVAKPKPMNKRLHDTWKAWAESTDCDSDGQNDFYGLQKLVVRSVAESGEVLVRRRFRRPEDGLAIPLQLQVLEADYIDTDKNELIRSANGLTVGRIVHGAEFDALGRRTAYWLHPEHPGSTNNAMVSIGRGASRRIPAESIRHVYYKDRPGQVRGPTWFAPVLLKFKDYDEYSDATLMKQKIAACLAVIITDPDGINHPIGTVSGERDEIDSLEPGMMPHVAPGSSIDVVQPPQVREHGEYSSITLHEIAAGLNIPYEDMVGDWSRVNYSSARMSRLSHWDDVEDWRWQMLIPQFCGPVWGWAMEAAGVMGMAVEGSVLWTPPPMKMIEPDKEGLAHMRNIRAGLTTLPEVLRERGYDPDDVLKEIQATNEKLDDMEIVLDSDPRKTTQAGNPTAQIGGGGMALAAEPEDDPEPPEDDEDDDAEEAERARAHDERMALVAVAHARAVAPPPPVVITIEKGAVQVDARTTIAQGAVQTTVDSPVTIAKDSIRVDARTTVAAGAVQLPLTIAEAVHVPAGRHAVERGKDGEIVALVAEDVPSGVIVAKPGPKRGK
jgi:lambda family phage portal protein